ncbi:helix-turn-helix domain-containing protein [Acerihabitans sp. KWT182]|uniref:Helix-turn-helix domain-containing protein n=1 Tax=Acerihabitans sp. KWT182 TaxID=3157919 RepID=A0AAU7QAZ2_9GAMM
MNKANIIAPERLLVNTFKEGINSPTCWLVETGENVCRVDFHWGNETTHLELSRGWRGILLMNRVNIGVISGAVKQQELPLFALVKLQVFIDEAKNLTMKYEQPQHWESIELNNYPHITSFSDVERWLLSQNHQLPMEMALLASFLRRTEWYWLIRFLLNESVHSGKLHELGARYGLSYSHFRRLCRNALGNSAKSELRGWRIARALLDVVEEGQSLTQVAMRYGYASSSHLSNDIRDAFGVSPRGLWNMINKKSEK